MAALVATMPVERCLRCAARADESCWGPLLEVEVGGEEPPLMVFQTRRRDMHQYVYFVQLVKSK